MLHLLQLALFPLQQQLLAPNTSHLHSLPKTQETHAMHMSQMQLMQQLQLSLLAQCRFQLQSLSTLQGIPLHYMTGTLMRL
jgi:hypothetical protein